MSPELTIGEFVLGILPGSQTSKSLPQWPPNCFAVAMAVLKRTGAYANVFTDRPGKGTEGALEIWTQDTQALGAKWKIEWSHSRDFNDLAAEWQLLCDHFPQPLYSVNKNRTLLDALMKLVAVSDEASKGVGAPYSESDDEFLLLASLLLENTGSLCVDIDWTRVRVLPRMHTPQNGLTERSLSLYLSLCDPSEVTPRWLSTQLVRQESLNLLLVPWPLEVLVHQFRDVTTFAPEQLPASLGFFSYDASGADDELFRLVGSAFNEAMRKLGRVDGVVLPELATTESQFRAIRGILPNECFLVSGIGSSSTSAQRGTNEVRLSFPPLMEEVIQKKHHPWKLDRQQVIQYGLGGVLTPSREWWEYGHFTDRQLSFVSMSDDLVLAVLVGTQPPTFGTKPVSSHRDMEGSFYQCDGD